MAEIDEIRQRAKRNFRYGVPRDQVNLAIQDRRFLLTLIDTMARDHLEEIRQMEENFRTYLEARHPS